MGESYLSYVDPIIRGATTQMHALRPPDAHLSPFVYTLGAQMRSIFILSFERACSKIIR